MASGRLGTGAQERSGSRTQNLAMGQTSKVTLLVDLANSSVFRGIYRPTVALMASRLDSFLVETCDALNGAGLSPFPNIHVRLYDGWFDMEGRSTDLHGMIRKCVRNYPTRTRSYRLFVEIAESLLGLPGERLLHTFREKAGVVGARLKVAQACPGTCSSPDDCCLEHLRCWLKGKCPAHPSCITPLEAVCTTVQQKLVDAMLVADLIWSASEPGIVALFSDDEDVVPGLLSARARGARVFWLGSSTSIRQPYAPVLARAGVEYLQC